MKCRLVKWHIPFKPKKIQGELRIQNFGMQKFEFVPKEHLRTITLSCSMKSKYDKSLNLFRENTLELLL